MDLEKIVDFLNELVKRRNQEQVQNQEMNNWLEDDDHIWQDRTDEIHKFAEELEKSSLDDYKSKFLYLAAEFDNYKKRVVKSESYAHDKAFQDVILHFLNVYDDMERLYKEVQVRAASESDGNDEVDIRPVDSGFEMIFENFEKTLKTLGCEKIDVGCGDEFDVNTMEAISAVETKPDEGYKKNEVYEILQSGWKYKDKVLRVAKVIVSNN